MTKKTKDEIYLNVDKVITKVLGHFRDMTDEALEAFMQTNKANEVYFDVVLMMGACCDMVQTIIDAEPKSNKVIYHAMVKLKDLFFNIRHRLMDWEVVNDNWETFSEDVGYLNDIDDYLQDMLEGYKK